MLSGGHYFLISDHATDLDKVLGLSLNPNPDAVAVTLTLQS